MEVKFQRRKPEAVRILNRIVTVASDALECEADQRHEELLMKNMGTDEGSMGLPPRGATAKRNKM